MKYLVFIALIVLLAPMAHAQTPCGAAGFGAAGNASCGAGGAGGTVANQAGSDAVYNVLNYNNGALNDTTIQLAINAAAAAATTTSAPTVYIPAGSYLTNNPIFITNANTNAVFPTIRGASGMVNTTIPATDIIPTGGSPRIFPAVIVYPSNYISTLGTISAPALVGSGNSLKYNSGKPFFIVINDVTWRDFSPSVVANNQPLNGLSAFTLQMYFTTPNASTAQTLLNSNLHTTATGVLDLHITAGGAVSATLNTTGGPVSISGGSISANTTYWVAVSYTGSNTYLYLATPGSSSVSPVASSAQTGTLVQAQAETMSLGGGGARWPTNGNSTTPFVGQIDSVDLDKSALYNGGAVTAPNAKFTAVATGLYLNNFDSITPTINGVVNAPVVSVTALGGSVNMKAYHTIWNSTYQGGATGPEISDIATGKGTIGWMLQQVPQTHLSRLSATSASYAGFQLGNNDYFSVLNDIIDPSSSGVAGILYGWSVSTSTHVQIGGTPYGIVCGSFGCGTLIHPLVNTGPNSIAAIFQANGATGFLADTILDAGIDNENGGNVAAVEIGAIAGTVDLVGGTYISSGTASDIQCDDTCRVNMLGGLYFTGNNSTPVIDFVNTSVMTTPIISTFGAGIESPIMSNKPEWISQSGCGSTVTLVGGKGTLSSNCISANSVCTAKDITSTSVNDNCTIISQAVGSVTVGNGNPTDVCKVTCQ